MIKQVEDCMCTSWTTSTPMCFTPPLHVYTVRSSHFRVWYPSKRISRNFLLRELVQSSLGYLWLVKYDERTFPHVIKIGCVNLWLRGSTRQLCKSIVNMKVWGMFVTSVTNEDSNRFPGSFIPNMKRHCRW